MNAKIRLLEFLKAELNAASPGEIPTEEANRIVFSLWEKSKHSKKLCNEAINKVGGVKPSKRIMSFKRESANFLDKLASSSSLTKTSSVSNQTPSKENITQQSSGNVENSSLEKMRKAWRAYKRQETHGGSKEIQDIFFEENKETIDDGEKVLLLTAIFELRVYRAAIQLSVESGAGEKLRKLGDVKNGLMVEFKYQYDKFDHDEKWRLLPLFFDLQMETQKSHYMGEQEILKFYPLFLESLKKDNISLSNLKEKFLNSGYNQLMPFILTLDPEIFGQGQKNHAPDIKEASPSAGKKEDKRAEHYNNIFLKLIVMALITIILLLLAK